MTDVKIYDFWYKCYFCRTENSISQSSPLQERQVLNCIKCKRAQRVTYIIQEPQIRTEEKFDTMGAIKE